MTTYYGGGVTNAKNEIISRYGSFFQKLRCSASEEVRVLALIAGRYMRTTTGSNLRFIADETNIDPWVEKTWTFRNLLNKRKSEVPVRDRWRLPYLSKLLEERQMLHYKGDDETMIQELINSLCSN